MNYGEVAKQTLESIGGKENIISAAHCATRLRLVIADNKKCKKEEIENIEGVKGVFEASGQLQIIFGTGVVNKVFAEFAQLTGISQESTKEEVKQAAASRQNPFLRAIKSLGDIFVPIIPAIVASGLLMGILEGLCNAFPEMANSSLYTIIHLFSNAAFVFLPILIAISAAKTFGGNLFLGAVIGMIMIHPDLMNAWSVATAESVPTASVWFGLYDVNLVGYQGHVIPVVIAVWLMCVIEKRLHKIVPEMFDLFVTPLVTVLVTGYLTLTLIGPVFVVVENGVLDAAKWIITLPFGVGSAIAGGVYAPTVVVGLHHMYNALEAGLLSSDGLNTWMPIATAANVGQGAAALALALKTRNTKTRAIALPASLSAFLGITEPAIFGVNLRFVKPFIAGCIGGVCGGLVAGILHIGATAYGITGVFGFLITTHYAVGYLLVMLTSAVVSFVVSWLLYREEVQKTGKTEDGQQTEENGVSDAEKSKESIQRIEGQTTGTEKQEAENQTAQLAQADVVLSPIHGCMMPLEEVKDETFANKILGDGMAVLPLEGVVVAPFDGRVETLFPTHHALGLVSESGLEVLIHVGLNTVELNGECFTPLVEEGQTIQAGQELLKFDLEAIRAKGYSITTPVIITNSDDYQTVVKDHFGLVETGQQIMNVSR